MFLGPLTPRDVLARLVLFVVALLSLALAALLGRSAARVEVLHPEVPAGTSSPSLVAHGPKLPRLLAPREVRS